MSQNIQPDESSSQEIVRNRRVRGCLDYVVNNAAMLLVLLIVGFALFSLARAAVYKIRPYERGLHLRGGAFVGIDQPGWHFQIPFVDTVITLNVIERSGLIDNLAAMTADDVTMDISLLYTYRVFDPVRYQLEVLDPDKIIANFVQGTLRDIVNTHKMDEVMHGRTEINQQVITELQKKQDQYGVNFILVQIQNSEFYSAQKKADGDAYQITALAKAQATQINLSSQAQIEALRQTLKELDGKGPLAEQYIQVLIAQELRENSKWIVSSSGTMPIIDLREVTSQVQPTPTAAAP
jgi:regulator of protease activity HflC (stomatin/prohibitin superfamily)